MGNEASKPPPQDHVARVLHEQLVMQPLPVATVGVKYCSPTPVEYEVSNARPWYFSVRDPIADVICFRKEQLKTFSSRDTLMDLRGYRLPMLNFYHDRVRLGTDDTAPELLKLDAKMELDTVELHVSFADVTTGERCYMGVEGNWRLHQAFLWLSRGSLSAEREAVARVWAPGGDDYFRNEVYTLTVAPNMDVALILFVCMGLDRHWLVYQNRRELL